MIKVQIVSSQVSSKRKSLYRNVAFLFLRHIGVVNQVGFQCVVLDFVIIHNRSFLCKNLGNRIGQYRIFIQTLVSFDNLHMGVFAYNYQVSWLNQKRRFRSGREIHNLNRLVRHFAFRNVDIRSFIGESRIQRSQTFVFVCNLIEIRINHHFVFGFSQCRRHQTNINSVVCGGR